MKMNRIVLACGLFLAGFTIALSGTGRALADSIHDVFIAGGSVGINPSSNTVTVGNPSLAVLPAAGATFPVSGAVAVSGAVTPNEGAGAIALYGVATDFGGGSASANGGGSSTIGDLIGAPFAVPAGQRMVVEFVHADLQVSLSSHLVSAFVRVNHHVGNVTYPNTLFLAPVQVGSNPFDFTYVLSAPFKAYLEAGDTMEVGFVTGSAATESQIRITLYGRLFPAI
jgi:hypothetical protein